MLTGFGYGECRLRPPVGTPRTRFLITELGNREIDANLYLYDFLRGAFFPRGACRSFPIDAHHHFFKRRLRADPRLGGRRYVGFLVVSVSADVDDLPEGV